MCITRRHLSLFIWYDITNLMDYKLKTQMTAVPLINKKGSYFYLIGVVQ